MKASFVAAIACAAVALTLTAACGSEDRSGKPASAITKEDTSYGQEEFIRDIVAAGWPASEPELDLKEGNYYYEALQQCNAQKSGSKDPLPLQYMGDLLRFNKSNDPDLASADVEAYLAAVRKTCGLE